MTETTQVVDTGTAPAAQEVAAPVRGTPEWDAAMVKKADDNNIQTKVFDASGRPVEAAAPAAEAPKPVVERPAHIPEKFWVATDENPLLSATERMAKSYGELEKSKQVRGEDGKFQPKTPALAAPDPAATPEGQEQQAREATKGAGVDYDALSTEYAEKGALSAESYAKLEAAGMPKSLVDSYIAGQQALTTQYEQTAHKVAGGTPESYTAMAESASVNLSAGELKAYNKAVTAGSLDDMTTAVKGVYARYQAAVGTQPRHMEMGGKAAGGNDVYTSLEDLSRDTRNPKYKTDPSFRAKVEQKAARSKF